jgi:hypothetical protein
MAKVFTVLNPIDLLQLGAGIVHEGIAHRELQVESKT